MSRLRRDLPPTPAPPFTAQPMALIYTAPPGADAAHRQKNQGMTILSMGCVYLAG
jgi:hypothetical protein